MTTMKQVAQQLGWESPSPAASMQGQPPRNADYGFIASQIGDAKDPRAAMYEMAVGMAKEDQDVNDEMELRGRIDDYFSNLQDSYYGGLFDQNPEGNGDRDAYVKANKVNGADLRGDNANAISMARTGLESMNNGLGTALDWVVDRAGDVAGMVSGDDNMRQAIYDWTDGEDLSFIPSIAEDIGLSMIPGVGIPLAVTKGAIENSDDIYRAVSGIDPITLQRLEGGQRIGAGASGVLGTAFNALPGIGKAGKALDAFKGGLDDAVEVAGKEATKAGGVLDSAKEGLKQSEETLAGLQPKQDKLLEEIAKGREGVDSLDNALGKAQETQTKMQERVDKIKGKKKPNEEKLKKAENRANAATEAVNEANGKLGDARNALAEKFAKYQENERMLPQVRDQLQADIAQMTSKVDDAGKAASSANEALANAKAARESYSDVGLTDMLLNPEIQMNVLRSSLSNGAKGKPSVGAALNRLKGLVPGVVEENGRLAVRTAGKAAAKEAEQKAAKEAAAEAGEEAAKETAKGAAKEATKEAGEEAASKETGKFGKVLRQVGKDKMAYPKMLGLSAADMLSQEMASGNASNVKEAFENAASAVGRGDGSVLLPLALAFAPGPKGRIRRSSIGNGSNIPYYGMKLAAVDQGIKNDAASEAGLSDNDLALLEAIKANIPFTDIER